MTSMGEGAGALVALWESSVILGSVTCWCDLYRGRVLIGVARIGGTF